MNERRIGHQERPITNEILWKERAFFARRVLGPGGTFVGVGRPEKVYQQGKILMATQIFGCDLDEKILTEYRKFARLKSDFNFLEGDILAEKQKEAIKQLRESHSPLVVDFANLFNWEKNSPKKLLDFCCQVKPEIIFLSDFPNGPLFAAVEKSLPANSPFRGLLEEDFDPRSCPKAAFSLRAIALPLENNFIEKVAALVD